MDKIEILLSSLTFGGGGFCMTVLPKLIWGARMSFSMLECLVFTTVMVCIGALLGTPLARLGRALY